jgi:hypothetical protein
MAFRGILSGAGNGTISATVRAAMSGGTLAAGDRVTGIAVVNGTNGSALSSPNTTTNPGAVFSGPNGSNNNSNAIVFSFLASSTDATNQYIDFTWAVAGRPSIYAFVEQGDPADTTASGGPAIFGTVALSLTAPTLTTLDDNAPVYMFLAFNESGVAPTVAFPAGFTTSGQASTTAGSGANMTAAAGYLTTVGTAGSYGGGTITASGATGPHSYVVAYNLPAVGAAVITASASMTAGATTSGTGSSATITATASMTAGASLVPAAAATITAAATLTTFAAKIFDFIPKQIGVIGDSLTYQYGNGATDIPTAFAARGWNSSLINAVGVTGRQIWAGGTSPVTKDTIDTWRALSPPFDPYLYVLPLGANMADSGASQSQNSSDWLSLLAYIGPGRKCYVIGIGYQTAGEGATSFNSGGTIGSRYSCVGDASSPNAAILNLIDAGLDSKVYPTVVFCDWDASTEATTARAGGTTYWLSTDSSSPSGTARHMTVIGYQNYRNPFTARMLDSELGQQGTATITATASMTAGATRNQPAAATITASASMTAAGTTSRPAAATITATASVTAAATQTYQAGATITATATVTAGATKAQPAAGTITAAVSVTAGAFLQQGATAIITTSASVTAGATTTAPGQAAAVITVVSSVTAGATQTSQSAAAITAVASLTTGATRIEPAAATILASAALTATGAISGQPTASITATAQLLVAAYLQGLAAAVITAHASMTATTASAIPSGRYVAGEARTTWSAGRPLTRSPH